MPTEDFNFLPEQPAQTSAEFSKLKFGHKDISATSVQIIKKCPAPFTIGLFGKWGSGKSTVAHSLRHELPKANIPVVIFDVWKHEGDDLRRTFLKELVSQLKEAGKSFFDQSFQLDERLERNVSHSSKSRLIFNEHVFRQIIFSISLILIPFLPFIFVPDYYFQFYIRHKAIIDGLLITFFGTATASIAVFAVIKQFFTLFSTETVSYGDDRFEDPHQFEQEFARTLTALKNRRILIIFDNLDRVMHDKVAEVLSTIKTFLEPEDKKNEHREVIFLVPCDAKAIKHHLSSIYNKVGAEDRTFDPDEFLRKFFNTIIWIPDFILSELESFATECLEKTGVASLKNSSVSWIITKAFRHNPRQVIQFINILLANYLLIKEREGPGKDFQDGFLKENVPQLTRYLVLNQLFPNEMDELREKKIWNLDEVKSEDISKADLAFFEFVEATKNIAINDLRIFFTLRRSEQEKKFPGFDSLIVDLEDGNLEQAAKGFDLLGDLSSEIIVYDLSQAIKQKLSGYTNHISLINFIKSLFSILYEKNIKLAATLYAEINNIFRGICKDQLHSIPPALLNEVFLSQDEGYRSVVVNQWIAVMTSIASGSDKYKTESNFSSEVVQIFSKNLNYLSQSQKKKLNQLLAEKFATQLDVIKAITQSEDSLAALASEDLVSNFIAGIEPGSDVEDLRVRLQILNKFTDSFIQPSAEEILLKFTELQLSANQKAAPENLKSSFITEYREFLRKHSSSSFAEGSLNSNDSFASSLIATYNNLPSFEERAELVTILSELEGFTSTTKTEEIEGLLAIYTRKARPETFDSTFEGLQEKQKEDFFTKPKIYDMAITRALSEDSSFRKNLLQRLPEDKKKDFINKFFDHDFSQAFSYFESLDKKEIKYVFAIFEKVWSFFDSASNTDKARILKFVNDRDANNDASLRAKLAEKIVFCLTKSDSDVQKVGLDAFNDSKLAKDVKKKIVKDVFEWLKKPEIGQKYQPAVLGILVSNFDLLNQTEKTELIQIFFGEIIQKSSEVSAIISVFQYLKNLRVTYATNKQDFENLKSKIESEGTPSVKEVLLKSLNNFRPARLDEFWKFIDAQKSAGDTEK